MCFFLRNLFVAYHGMNCVSNSDCSRFQDNKLQCDLKSKVCNCSANFHETKVVVSEDGAGDSTFETKIDCFRGVKSLGKGDICGLPTGNQTNNLLCSGKLFCIQCPEDITEQIPGKCRDLSASSHHISDILILAGVIVSQNLLF